MLFFSQKHFQKDIGIVWNPSTKQRCRLLFVIVIEIKEKKNKIHSSSSSYIERMNLCDNRAFPLIFSKVKNADENNRCQLTKNCLEKERENKIIIWNQSACPFVVLRPMWIDFLLCKVRFLLLRMFRHPVEGRILMDMMFVVELLSL